MYSNTSPDSARNPATTQQPVIRIFERLMRGYDGSAALRLWVQRLEGNREAALREVDEPTYRVWRLYMAACALEFEAGGTGIYQILASRRNRGEWPVPLSRQDLYTDPDGHFGEVN